MDPLTTGVDFLESMPHVTIGSLIWQQPSSSIFIFGLGVFIIIFGIKLLKIQKGNLSRKWWGISMIFWGVSAIFAGISYQAFGYQLKCLGNTYANFTDWFEIMYLLFTGSSICMLVFGMSYCAAIGKTRKIMQMIALISLPIYAVLLTVGSIAGIQFLVSYEMLCIFFMWHFIVFFVINIRNYRSEINKEMNKKFIITWSLFLILNILYYIYYLSGLSPVLYQNTGVWFNQNDLLHVLMIGWFVYMYISLPKCIVDRNEVQVKKNK